MPITFDIYPKCFRSCLADHGREEVSARSLSLVQDPSIVISHMLLASSGHSVMMYQYTDSIRCLILRLHVIPNEIGNFIEES